jgi:putative FmdB family regulatory protein
MPTYDYRCEKCGHEFERFQRMSEPPVKRCPECGGRVRRLIGAGAGVIVKGPGSHATDYARSEPSCGRESPCCGRETPCQQRSCDE